MSLTIGQKIYTYNANSKAFDVVEEVAPITSVITIEEISTNTQRIKGEIKNIEIQQELNKQNYNKEVETLTQKKVDLEAELEKALIEEESLTKLIQDNN